MNKFVLILFMASALALSGCFGGPQAPIDQNPLQPGTQQTYVTPEGSGTVTTTGNTGNTQDWCAAGSSWAWSGTASNGGGSADWKILGKEMYKGKEMCHVTMSSTAAEGTSKTEYYFSNPDVEPQSMYMKTTTPDGQVMEYDMSGNQ